MHKYLWVLVAACVPHSFSTSTSSTTPSSSSSSSSSSPTPSSSSSSSDSASSSSSESAADSSSNSFGVSIPAAVAEPSPPAHKDADGKIVPPGGPISEDERDCGPAKNHCMRGNAWLATGVSGPAEIREPATAAFPFDGHWYTYSGEQAGNTVYRTKPATADEIQHARMVWVLDVGHNEFSDVKSFLPKSEKDALTTRRWQRVSPESVDAKAGTFTADRRLYKIEAARIGVEAKSAD